MKNLTIYDPAMCCSTGICGADVDQNLVNFAADLDWLKSQGVDVRRINISTEPAEFVSNAKVKAILESDGVEGLPVIQADGETCSTSRFPNRAELAEWVDVEFTAAAAKPSTGCCGGDAKQAASKCC
uniref:Arsenical resistance operon transcriptional repressor ArsD n=1 Tax=OCS116 cluster bacterium TaxID=2030921 RepID=A0A2A4Z951_9PROT